jgi:hypothetical protein
MKPYILKIISGVKSAAKKPPVFQSFQTFQPFKSFPEAVDAEIESHWSEVRAGVS